MSDLVINAIVANQEQNHTGLADINLYQAGGDANRSFSASAKKNLAELRAKYLTTCNIAETVEEYEDMNKRFHPDE